MNKTLLLILAVFLFVQQSFAGPPFLTDDPEPVEYKHWEFYTSSINTFQSGASSGTIPHFEVNYGAVPNLQIHLLLPLNYNYIQPRSINLGYTNTEFGIKYRFIQEKEDLPQIGTFPIVEIPTVNNSKIANNQWQVYLPVWLQKSWGKFTTYGGAGYSINSGSNNKNWIFTGWEGQYDFSEKLTLGGELYYKSADSSESKSALGFNLGGFLNFTSKVHFIFSIGHNLTHTNFYTGYAGVLWTI